METLSSLSQSDQPYTRNTKQKFDVLIDEFLDRFDATSDPDTAHNTITLVTASLDNMAACTLCLRAEELVAAGTVLRVITASLTPQKATKDFLNSCGILAGGRLDTGYIRWARNAALMDAHEQLTLGTTMCWSGDTIRRAAGTPSQPRSRKARHTLELFDTRSLERSRLARLAFESLWQASALMPATEESRILAARTTESPAAHNIVTGKFEGLGSGLLGKLMTRH